MVDLKETGKGERRMKINSMITFHETTPNYLPYYVATIVIAIAVGYFLIIGGKVFRALFILGYQYWWVVLIIVLFLLFLRKKMRTK